MTVRAGPARTVAAALAEAGRAAPLAAVSTGPAPSPGWGRVRALYDDDTALAGLVERVRRRVGAAEARVAVSLLFQGWAARLWSIELAVLLRAGRLPDLSPDVLLWRDDEGSVRLHVEHPVELPGGADLQQLAAQVVDGHLRPLLGALRRLGPLSERLLWGDAASALAASARQLDPDPAGVPLAAAQVLLTRPPLAGALDQRPDGRLRRRSCCLYYRVPGGLCEDCVFDAAPRTPALRG